MHLFTYGTLTLPEVMQAVTGKSFRFSEAFLPGYERFCLVDQTYPGIVSTGQYATAGKVYFDIDELSEQRLDYFEDDLYVRQSVWLTLPDHSTINADTYVVPSSHMNQVSNRAWNEEQFRTSHLPQFLVQVQDWMREFPHNT